MSTPVDETPCPCGDCVRANTGRPAVKFDAVLWSPAYELHGVHAKRWYDAQAKALAVIADLKVKAAQRQRATSSEKEKVEEG